MLHEAKSVIRRAPAVVAAAALTTSLIFASHAPASGVVADGAAAPAPAPRGTTAPPDDGSTESALDALAAAEEILDPATGPGTAGGAPGDTTDNTSSAGDASLALLAVQQSFDDLPRAARVRARSLLQRPTDDGHSGDYDVSYGSRPQAAACTQHFCIHWVRTGQDSPDLADADGNGRPDYVDDVARVMEEVWRRQVEDLGYRRPVSDGRKDNPAGETRPGLVDVYLGNTGRAGVYGYANTDRSKSRNVAFLVLDNDFADFPGDPAQLLRVTAAHEFFHTAQFAYSLDADAWFMESTATWMEERVYDEVNDNRQYLRESSLSHPDRPLDHGTTWYGNWVFFEHLSQHHGNKVVRAAWNRVARGSSTSTRAIEGALRSRGSSLAAAFSLFSADANVPARGWSEGAHYPPAPASAAWKLSRSRRSTGVRTVRPAHLASRNITFTPGSGMTRAWRLRVTVEGTSKRARAYLLVQLRDGRLLRRPLVIDSTGRATRRLGFAKRDVARVTLNLANTSARFRCGQFTDYTCSGTPLDDGRRLRYKAVAKRA